MQTWEINTEVAKKRISSHPPPKRRENRLKIFVKFFFKESLIVYSIYSIDLYIYSI